MPKIKVTLKDPDVLYDAVEEQVESELQGMPDDEAEAVHDLRVEKYQEIASTWFEYGEYLTIEIDTDAKTARVVPVGEK